MTLLHFG